MAPTVAWAGGRSTGRHCAPGSGTRGDGARPGWRLGQQRPACHPHACSPARARGPGRWGLAVLTPFRTRCFQALTPLTGHCFLLFLNRFYWCSLRANDSFDEFQ